MGQVKVGYRSEGVVGLSVWCIYAKVLMRVFGWWTQNGGQCPGEEHWGEDDLDRMPGVYQICW